MTKEKPIDYCPFCKTGTRDMLYTKVSDKEKHMCRECLIKFFKKTKTGQEYFELVEYRRIVENWLKLETGRYTDTVREELPDYSFGYLTAAEDLNNNIREGIESWKNDSDNEWERE